jgi:hypothetical protein
MRVCRIIRLGRPLDSLVVLANKARRYRDHGVAALAGHERLNCEAQIVQHPLDVNGEGQRIGWVVLECLRRQSNATGIIRHQPLGIYPAK